MADLSDSTNWSETDSSNNKASPNGWPEGMMPSGVNDSARADKGALKRFWDRINPVQTITPASGLYTFVTANPTYPAGYINGEIYEFNAAAASVGGDTFQVNALGAKPIQRRIAPGPWGPIAALDITAAFPVRLCYNSTLNGGAGAFILLNPFVPITGDGAGGIAVGPITTSELRLIDPAAGSTRWSLYQTSDTFKVLHQTAGDRVAVAANGDVVAAGAITATGALHAGADIYINGQGLHFVGTTTTGPYLQASNVGWTARAGSGNGLFQFADAANTVHSNVNFATGDITTLGNLLPNLIYMSGDSIHFVGATSAGPYIQAGNSGWAMRAGSGNGLLQFADSANAVHASINFATGDIITTGSFTGGYVHSTGNIQADGTFTGGGVSVTGDVYAPMLRGGLGQDVGVLRMAPTGVDPSPHTVFFGWDASGEAFYRITDSTVALLVSSGGSGNVRSVFLQVDGGTPSGWRLAVQQGVSNFYIFVDFTSSDARMKRGIGDSEVDALAALCAVPVRKFEWLDEVQELFGVRQGPVAIGLVAQDLLPHMPDCVGISERAKPYPADTHTIMHDRIDAYVIRAIQQLEARIAQLEGK